MTCSLRPYNSGMLWGSSCLSPSTLLSRLTSSSAAEVGSLQLEALLSGHLPGFELLSGGLVPGLGLPGLSLPSFDLIVKVVKGIEVRFRQSRRHMDQRCEKAGHSQCSTSAQLTHPDHKTNRTGRVSC